MLLVHVHFSRSSRNITINRLRTANRTNRTCHSSSSSSNVTNNRHPTTTNIFNSRTNNLSMYDNNCHHHNSHRAVEVLGMPVAGTIKVVALADISIRICSPLLMIIGSTTSSTASSTASSKPSSKTSLSKEGRPPLRMHEGGDKRNVCETPTTYPPTHHGMLLQLDNKMLYKS